MVEMRWVSRYVPAPEPGDLHRKEWVLRYRYLIFYTDAQGRLMLPGAEWSDWVDVPIAEEG
jgi:hypothetical protein